MLHCQVTQSPIVILALSTGVQQWLRIHARLEWMDQP